MAEALYYVGKEWKAEAEDAIASWLAPGVDELLKSVYGNSTFFGRFLGNFGTAGPATELGFAISLEHDSTGQALLKVTIKGLVVATISALTANPAAAISRIIGSSLFGVSASSAS